MNSVPEAENDERVRQALHQGLLGLQKRGALRLPLREGTDEAFGFAREVSGGGQQRWPGAANVGHAWRVIMQGPQHAGEVACPEMRDKEPAHKDSQQCKKGWQPCELSHQAEHGEHGGRYRGQHGRGTEGEGRAHRPGVSFPGR